MSVSAIAWVFRNGPTDTAERMVLLAIADYLPDGGEWSPSVAGIAAKAGMTERGARGIIRRLENGGWLAVKVGGGRGGKSTYRLNTDRNLEQETRNDKPGMINPEPQTRNEKSINPERDDTKPGTSVPPNRQRTIKEPSTRARDVLRTILSEEAADQFIAHRKSKRANLTENAAALIVDKLRGHPKPDDVVRLSIMNGWTGVFPESPQAVARGSPAAPPDEHKRAFLRKIAGGTG